ncbi:MAG: SulP family inorganic anion transporter [Halieaceae bacterium]|jgi:MFS superfamily sulfate permease-like transporter|nr:SulP family inorganic anion transporter [Halieaceae bacterium]
MANNIVTLPGFQSAKRDIPAGIVVFLVALPLCLGIALASGAPLFSGVIAGVIGGLVVSLLSGSELSVSGPAAGLAVIVASAIASLGSFEAFTVAVMLSGFVQLIFGLLRAGMIGDYIPNSVIKGMLAAIGIVIFLKQIPHALGYDRDYLGDEAFLQSDQLNTFTTLIEAFSNLSIAAVTISAVSLLLLLLWERPFMKRMAWTGIIPAPLLVVIGGVIINEAFGVWSPELKLRSSEHLVTLPVASSPADFFSMFSLPDFGNALNPEVWIVAATIALVGSIETLLCIEATDKLDPEKRISDTNRELRAQGIGNTISGLLGGLPITSVIVRSSANVYAGARTRLSSFVHGLVMIVAVAFLAALLNRIPLAALASILLVVGYKLASRRIIMDMWSRGAADFIPFFVTVVAIVFTDLLTGICIGFLAGIFFVVRSNYHAAITVVREGDNLLMRFGKDMSFVNKAALKRALRRIPDNAFLIVDGTKSLYVDGDIYETIREFETAAGYRGIRLEYHNFFDKQLKR